MVPYCCQDNVPYELTELLRQSSNEFIGQLFAEETTEAPGRKKKTVLAKFKVRYAFGNLEELRYISFTNFFCMIIV